MDQKNAYSQQRSGGSPLRFKHLQKGDEGNRDDDIRRQIATKEQEIQSLSKHSDFLRKRLDDTMGFQNPNAPQRDRSPVGAGPPAFVKDHLSALQNDNTSLMRRLNLVLQELDRVQKEKEDLQKGYVQSTKQSHELQRRLNDEDNVDKANRYMHDDLSYEKDRNDSLREKVKEEEMIKNKLLKELDLMRESSEETAQRNSHYTTELHKKISQTQDLEKEHYYTQEKIKQLTAMIDDISESDLKTNIEKQDLQRVMNSMIAERNELIRRLDVLTRKYDDAVQEITAQRRSMERANHEHQQFLAAKIMFTELEKIGQNRKKIGIDELSKYNKFDSKCNASLAKFSAVLERTGHFRLRSAITRWHGNVLKPIQARVQSFNLAAHGDTSRTQGKYFYLWRNLFQQRLEKYDLKSQAVRVIMNYRKQDLQKEVKRSFDIWKGTNALSQDKQVKLFKVINRTSFSKLQRAFTQWQGYSKHVESQIRLQMLAQEFSTQQFNTVLLHGMRKACFEKKSRRFVHQFKFFKAWKDYIVNKKYMFCQNVASFHFTNQNKTSLLKACFDALKQSKEEEKLAKTNFALTQDEKPMIQGLENEISQREAEAMAKARSRACEAVSAMGSRNVGTYFEHWKQRQNYYKVTLDTKVKDRIIKVYNDRIRHFFMRWKENADSTKIDTHKTIIMEHQEEGAQIGQELETVNKDIVKREEGLDRSQKSSTLKCVVSFNKKLLQLAMGRWRDRCITVDNGENAADVIIKRMRARLCRDAFNKYKAMVQLCKKEDKDEERCAYFNKTRDERLKDRCLASWIVYTKNFHRAKEYWYRLFLRLDLSMKRRAVKKWKGNSQSVVEDTFEEQQTALIENIQSINENLGKLSTKDESQRSENKDLDTKMRNQAKRVIYNGFARWYYVGETRGFEKWKEFVEHKRKQESIMKKMINHWKNYQFYFLKSALKNWMLNADIQERSNQLKHETMLATDTQGQIDIQNKLFSNITGKLNEELQAVQNEQEKFNNRLRKQVGTMISHTDKHHYMSKRRYILTQWRQYVSNQKGFIMAINNIVQKSLWKEGFCAIKEAARDDTRKELVDTVMNRFRLKFWKRTCGNAFSNWRGSVFNHVVTTFEEDSACLTQDIEVHQAKIRELKDKNSDQATRVVVDHYLLNLFVGWKNVTDHHKLQRQKDIQLVLALQHRDKSFAVRQWLGRTRATKLARHRNAKLIKKYHSMRLQFFFNALKSQYKNTKGFANRLNNLAMIMDTQSCKVAFGAINSYARSKKHVQEIRKQEGTKGLESHLKNIYLRKLGSHFNELRTRATNKEKDRQKKMRMVIYNMNHKIRHAFSLWAKNTGKINVAQEMQEEGPVREQIFEKRQVARNLEDFLKKEGYDPDNIDSATQTGVDRRHKLMLKAIRRMQHYNDEENSQYLKPKVLDIWRRYVHLRKLMRFWLDYTQKRSEYIKSDLAVAFDRWKSFYTKYRSGLEKLPREDLESKILSNAKVLGQKADELGDREETLEHMENQRDALVENYIKGQRLALCLWRNNLQRDLWRSFKDWNEFIEEEKRRELEEQLKKNVELITQMKDKMRTVEKDNIDLSAENEELRQFSLDGYEIAKNVKALAKERETLSVDLADKASTIRKLLDENEALQSRLKSAQSEAAALLTVSKQGGRGYSPSAVKGSY